MAQIDDFKANLLGGGARANQYRVTITPKHQAEDIKRFLSSLNQVWDKLSLRRESYGSAQKSQVTKIY